MVKERMDFLGLLRKRGMDGDVDFLREALGVLVEAIMDAEVTAKIGAGYGERSLERATQRNGYRSRPWDTRVGTLEMRIPKLQEGATSRASSKPGGAASGHFLQWSSKPTWKASPPGASTTW